MYKSIRWRLKNAIEVEEHADIHSGAPGEKRGEKLKPTPEQMEKVNQKNKENLARRKLRQHFDENDYFTDLTYKRELRPADMDEAKKDFSKFIRKVREAYRKRGAELKWIRNIEVGTKNGWHIHLVINRIPDTDLILKKCWGHGKVVSQLMYEAGEFRKLAAYITKSPKTDTRLRESSYSTSKNLPLPKPKKKKHRKWKEFGKVRIPKGWYLEPDSYYEGINKLGFRYRGYTLLKIRKHSGDMSRDF